MLTRDTAPKPASAWPDQNAKLLANRPEHDLNDKTRRMGAIDQPLTTITTGGSGCGKGIVAKRGETVRRALLRHEKRAVELGLWEAAEMIREHRLAAPRCPFGTWAGAAEIFEKRAARRRAVLLRLDNRTKNRRTAWLFERCAAACRKASGAAGEVQGRAA